MLVKLLNNFLLPTLADSVVIFLWGGGGHRPPNRRGRGYAQKRKHGRSSHFYVEGNLFKFLMDANLFKINTLYVNMRFRRFFCGGGGEISKNYVKFEHQKCKKKRLSGYACDLWHYSYAITIFFKSQKL